MDFGSSESSDRSAVGDVGEAMDTDVPSHIALFNGIKKTVDAKAKLLNDVKEKRVKLGKELEEKHEKLKLISELKRVEETDLARLQCQKENANEHLKEKEKMLEERRKEVENLQLRLKEEEKRQDMNLSKFEEEMAILSRNFLEAPIIYDTHALECELKVLQAMSDEVKAELKIAEEKAREAMEKYNEIRNVPPITDQTVGDELNVNAFLQQIKKSTRTDQLIHTSSAHLDHTKKRSDSIYKERGTVCVRLQHLCKRNSNIYILLSNNTAIRLGFLKEGTCWCWLLPKALYFML